MESETEYVPDSTTGSDSADSFVIPLPSRCPVEVSQESQSTSSRVLISEATSSNNSVTTKSTLTQGNIEVSSTNSLTSAAGELELPKHIMMEHLESGTNTSFATTVESPKQNCLDT